MRRSRSILSAVTALLVGAGALAAAAQGKAAKGDHGKPPARGAVTITAGDDAFTTRGAGKTVFDLADYPVAKVFGAKFTGSSRVSLKGKPLSAELGPIDTVVRRPKDIVLKGGKGSGPLEIAALSLESEKPVSIGGKNYQLHVGLSDTGKDEHTRKPGRISLTMKGGDGGTFSSSLPVWPKLVFTPEGGGQPVTIDCGAVPCGKGAKGIVLLDKSSPWAMTGGPGKFDPASLSIRPIKGGVTLGGEGFASYTTTGSSNFYPGISSRAGGAVVHLGLDTGFHSIE